ncbi:hypothetical protein FACS1894202_11090 [Clostridia bacterium]|nr:hypothetical protein FACS1894202_11090 [Clostridia bacterium]
MTYRTARQILRAAELSARDKAVYLELVDRSNASDTCYPSVTTIAKGCRLSESSVHRAIASLIALGLVNKIMRHRENNGCTSNLYELTPGLSQIDTGDGITVTPGVVSNASATDCAAVDTNTALAPELDNTFKSNNLTTLDMTGQDACELSEISLSDILQSCDLDFVEQEYGAWCGNMFRNTIRRLYYSEKLRIGNAVLPQREIRKSLRYLNANVITTAIYKLRHNRKREVRDSAAYVAAVLFNTITEWDTDWEVSA